MKSSFREAEILNQSQADLQQAFRELFLLYSKEVYSYCYIGLFHHSHLAEQVTIAVFRNAYKYFHTVVRNGTSYRSYLFSLAVSLVIEQRSNLQSAEHDGIRYSKRFWSVAQKEFWQTAQDLDPATFTIFDLWSRLQFQPQEIALFLGFEELEVIRRYQIVQESLQESHPNFEKELSKIYVRSERWIPWSHTLERRIFEAATSKQRHAPTFVRPTWWTNILGPIPAGFALGLVAISVGALWYTYAPQPLAQEFVNTSNAYISIEPTVAQRPSDVTVSAQLPAIHIVKHSLTEVTEPLFGTDYVVKRDAKSSDQEEVHPTISVNLPVNEYQIVSASRIYGAPEQLSENNLQLAAYNYFYSLPLNQFTYVNGTYYIPESDTDFRPLFVALHGDGSIEYQMRQAAICTVEGLTDEVDESTARQIAYDFLHSHRLIEVEQTDAQIVRVSPEGRTLEKGTFCNNDDTAAVHDYEFVFYSPHQLIRFDNGAKDLLPIRARGVAVQVHGKTVTNVRVDNWFGMQEHIVQTSYSDLLTLQQAISLVQAFYYPNVTSASDHERYQRVFAQWNHQHGDDRLQEINLDRVRLEYVYDSLNYLVEPYYVFSGNGRTASTQVDIRMYVAASQEDIELRSPYRE